MSVDINEISMPFLSIRSIRKNTPRFLTKFLKITGNLLIFRLPYDRNNAFQICTINNTVKKNAEESISKDNINIQILF